MFICQIGGHTTPPKTPQVKIVTEVREVTYQNRVKQFDESGVYLGTEMVESKGHEIVREIEACPDCVKKMELPKGWKVQ